MHSLVLLAAAKSSSSHAVTINVAWLVAGGFAAAFGAALWKALPWAIKKALDEKIDSKLVPMMDDVHTEMTGVHDRINSHMDNEEDSFGILSDKVQSVQNEIAERSDLFVRTSEDLSATLQSTKEVLEQHMHSDEQQFLESAEALIQGQAYLDARLARIEKNTAPTTPEPEKGDSFS